MEGVFMIKAILVDDEELSLQLLRKQLNKIGGVDVVATFSNGEEFLEEMKQIDFQVAFLDIEISGINGLELADIILDYNSNISIVFITAYRDFAIQAFEIHSLDYLLKPITESRLHKTINRLQHHIRTDLKNEQKLLTVQCFDEFIVYFNNEPLQWKTAKVKELFAYFIMNHKQYIHRDTIINQLWANIEYKKAKIQLHTTLSYLRKLLTSLGYNNCIKFINQSYIFTLDSHVSCDMYEFDEIHKVSHSLTTAIDIQLLEKLVSLYNGDYMIKNEYDWTFDIRMHYRNIFMQHLQKLCQYYANSKDRIKEREALQRFLQFDPYSEHAIQQLMKSYIDEGNRAEAIQIYQDFLHLLLEDLGINPDMTTQKLYQTII